MFIDFVWNTYTHFGFPSDPTVHVCLSSQGESDINIVHTSLFFEVGSSVSVAK